MKKASAVAIFLCGLAMQSWGAVGAITEYYPGNDATNPWGLKLERDFNGKLTTYFYWWEDAGETFVTQTWSGGGATPDSTTVTSGTVTETRLNKAGKVISWKTCDIETGGIVGGVVLDFGTATDATEIFPSSYQRPLATTESYTYDGQGQVLTHTDQLGKQTTYTQDALYRVTKVVRDGVTWDIAYNPTHLGRKVTCTSTAGKRVTEETTSPFGKTQIVEVTGPENTTVTRTETEGTITTDTVNSTTGRNVKEVETKSTKERLVSGNATEPLDVTYSFPGGGWKETVVRGGSKSSTTYNAAGEMTLVESPSPNGTGMVATNYAYDSAKWEVTASDPDGKTVSDFRGNGELAKVSRGERSLTVTRSLSGSGIQWVWTNGEGETERKKIYSPGLGKTEDYPWGKDDRKLTTQAAISQDELTLTTTGLGITQTQKWKDGVSQASSLAGAGLNQSATAALNKLGEVTQVDTNFGGEAGPSTMYSLLGLPTQISGVAGMATATFPATPFSKTGNLDLSMSRGGHITNAQYSPKGYELKRGGYGAPVVTSTEPSFGSSVIKSFEVPGASGTSQQLTFSPAGPLTKRSFPDGSSESFSYTAGGALNSWNSPQGSLSFVPNAFGEPTRLGGAAWGIVYDKVGRLKEVSDRAGKHTRTYTDGQLQTESHTTGPLAGQSVTRAYDKGRLQQVSLPESLSYSYTYNADGSLDTVTTAGGLVARWSNYNATTGRPKSFQVVSGGATFSTSTGINVLGQVTAHSSTARSGTTSFGYGYNGNGQCSSLTTPEGQWNMDYDSHGFLSSGAGTGLSYAWDAAGRRLGSSGDYMATSRSNGSQVLVMGSATPGASVTITNGTPVTPTLSASGAFVQPYAATPNSWQSYLVNATQGSAQAEALRQIFIPPSSEVLGHDTSGNRTTDARWTFGWNELDQLGSAVDNNPNGATAISFLYDFQGRMVQKTVSVAGKLKRRTTTLYDGWKPVVQIDYNGSNAEIARRIYTWGPDMSGSFDGSAGIGGLIEVVEKKPGVTHRCLALNDGMGNVVGLVDETSGDNVATFRSGPFGEVISTYGPRAAACSLHWQSKLYDEDLGLYYFGKRWYDPGTRGFISRDPLREAGGVNLVAYCNNQPVGNCDPIGLSPMFGTEPYIAALTAQAEGKNPAEVSQAISDAQQANIEAGKMMAPVVVAGGVTLVTAGGAAPFAVAALGEGSLATAVTAIVAGGAGTGVGQVTSNVIENKPLTENVVPATLWGAATGGVFSLSSETAIAFTQGFRGSSGIIAPLESATATTTIQIGQAGVGVASVGNATTTFGRMRSTYRFLQGGQYLDEASGSLRSLSRGQIREIMSGIDFTKSVEIVTALRSTEFIQFVRNGGRVGPWFAEPGTLPSQVGLFGAERTATPFTTMYPTTFLRSTAAPIFDTWTVRGASVPTEGGAFQYFTFQGFKLRR